jgi:Family of unknown function (DUF6340)
MKDTSAKDLLRIQFPMEVGMKKPVLLISLMLALPFTLCAQFGASKCDAKVQRLVPPPTRIQGPLHVMVKPGGGSDATLASQVQSQLESSLIKLDPALTISAASPQTQLEAEISEYTDNRAWENRTEKEYKKTGTKQVYNPKTKAYETQDVWDNVDVTKRYLVVKSTLKVTWRALAATKQLLASNLAQYIAQSSYLEGKDVPDQSSVKGGMANKVVSQIAQNLVPYPETIEVLIAKGPSGKLEPACKLAQAGQWTRALESWATIPTFKDPKDEAYRIYNIGLAHEIMGYSAGDSQDFESALSELDKAAENYGLAADKNTGEKYFKDPQARIKTSLQYYTALRDQNGNRLKPNAGGGGNSGPTVSGGLTNDQVIEFVRSGFSEDFVVDQIRTSKNPSFGVTPADLIKLKQAGVNERIITEMIHRK